MTSEADRAGEVYETATIAVAGAGLGAAVGSATGRGAAAGAGTGAAIGAGVALLGIFLQRGPDAVLAKGSTLEMVLDREMVFDEKDLDFAQAPVRLSSDGAGPMPSNRRTGLGRGRIF